MTWYGMESWIPNVITTKRQQMQRSRNTNLLPRAALDQVRLWHDLYRVLLVRVKRCDFVNLRESSLPQQLPPQVGVDRVPVPARALSVFDDGDRLSV